MQDLIEATKVKNCSECFVMILSKQLTHEEEKLIKTIVHPGPESKFFDITTWNNSPHIMLRDRLIGCTEQCPFCGEQCELTDPNHLNFEKDHFVHIHRPECLGKHTMDNNKQLVLSLCTCLVESKSLFKNRHQ